MAKNCNTVIGYQEVPHYVAIITQDSLSPYPVLCSSAHPSSSCTMRKHSLMVLMVF